MSMFLQNPSARSFAYHHIHLQVLPPVYFPGKQTTNFPKLGFFFPPPAPFTYSKDPKLMPSIEFLILNSSHLGKLSKFGSQEPFLKAFELLVLSMGAEDERISAMVVESLDHCITAPEGSHKNLFMDRLSDLEKENFILNLVKIQNDSTLELDLSKSAPVASKMSEPKSIEGPPCNIDHVTTEFNKSVPKLKIAMVVVGTRGDVQPFLAVAKRLQEFGHHVRLATHVNFSTFAIIESLLPACTEPDIETGHAHVAEALGVPLHIFFTIPWTPTNEFPHPLIRSTPKRWLLGMFLTKKLKLAPIAYFSWYHGSISYLPTAYMWSPHVVPKPSGPQPIYIGFGSMLLEDPKKTTEIILEALKNTGQRGIIDRGWGGLGTQFRIVFCLVDCPHDWSFSMFGQVHHGGAGTTATGLRAGCPTTIVPFFGDQFFWGDRLYQKGLGPTPIPISQLSVGTLSDAIRFMLKPEVKSRAMEVAKLIENEDGVVAAVDAFHRHLPPEILHCQGHFYRTMTIQTLYSGSYSSREIMFASLWFVSLLQ
ncbi:Sterol 3-beta-glucosyltransferase UGT80B1 [Camellia lanceoleosa]|nr:Sterol 3-beta-glucosyltransferase UGT80B1 [Camellia lanceoleosa]